MKFFSNNLKYWGKYFLIFLRRSFKHFLDENKNESILQDEILLGDNRYHVFFGYYDISPFSMDETRILALKAPLKLETPKPSAYVKVGYYNLANGNGDYVELAETNTWNWQQGCRLQWYPRISGDKIIYNSLANNKCCSIVQDIFTKKTKAKYDRPIYSVSDNGKHALSLNFSRLQRLRPGYGYTSCEDNSIAIKMPIDDGVWLINLETEKNELLFSIADIVYHDCLPSMKGAEHYFNHLLFNPSGSRFLFFHLWVSYNKRHSRLLTSDLEGNDIRVLDNESILVSHYIWRDNDEILATNTHPQNGFQYVLYNDRTGKKEKFGGDVLIQDGHPTFLNHDLIVTDSYPDKCRDQKLYIYDLVSNKLTTLGSFYSPLMYRGEWRCDLHPRMSPSGKYICVDTVRKRKRVMKAYAIDKKSTIFSNFR